MIAQENLPQSLLTACDGVEASLAEVKRLLLDPRPEALDRCESELRRVIEVLEELSSRSTAEKDPVASTSLHRIIRVARILGHQIEYAANLHLGFAQLRLGTGYTSEGLPVFLTGEERSSFEA